MTRYLLTGGTGFLGRRVLERLLRHPTVEVHALVRPASLGELQRLADDLEATERVHAVVGDLTQPGLGVPEGIASGLVGVIDEVVHLGALYDMTAGTEDSVEVNVSGTRRVVEFARRVGAARLHYLSSVAVAGGFSGDFAEDMFDVGQRLPSPYHATKFQAERLVRANGRDLEARAGDGQAGAPAWRIYRPSIVVGDSRSGATDKVDGPYYFFPSLASLGDVPGARHVPLVCPDLGSTNLVPVDYVADALAALIRADGLDYRTFHLVNPRPQRLIDVYNAFARAAGAPQVVVGLNRRLFAPAVAGMALLGHMPGARTAVELALARLGIPLPVMPHLTFPARFVADATRATLDALGVPEPPAIEEYAEVLWRYWRAHLDPLAARRPRPGGPLANRTVVVTGASSGIGRATALAIARRGGVPLLLARRADELEKLRAEIGAAGGQAFVYPVDLTSAEAVSACVKQMLADHDGIDMLVNNAGRSIRRSVERSFDRFHDFERTMALNYFAPVRLVLELLPHMTQRRFGHIVNISSIGVQAHPPRFAAYVASKAALDAFSRVAATELVGDGVTFTTLHMPLVRTPMIAPTKIYDSLPTLSPEDAAGLVVRALQERPKHLGTALGTLAVVADALAPRLTDTVLYTAYQAFPDSTAAGGADVSPRDTAPEALSRGAAALARLLPGVYW